MSDRQLQIPVICLLLLAFNILIERSVFNRAYTLALLADRVEVQRDNVVDNQTNHPVETNGTLEDFDTAIWPPMKQVLCVKGAPNLQLSSLLFQLARSEVFEKGVKESYRSGQQKFLPTRNETDVVTPSPVVKRFFYGGGGATYLKGRNENGRKFRTMYLRIWKCANNQIEHMIDRLYIGMNGTSIIHGEIWPLFKLARKLKRRTKAPLCIHTAIRDPISHFLSGYNEAEYRIATDWKNDQDQPIEPAPYHFRVPHSKSSPVLRRKRFQALVEDLLLEEPNLKGVYQHFFPMSRVLSALADYGLSLTGYNPTVENITSTWPQFMSSTCPGFLARDTIENMFRTGPPVELQNGGHKSSLDKHGFYEAAKEVWREGGPIARALCLLHAFDYACFEDLPEGIPELCRTVYREYSEEIVGLG